MKGLQNTKLLVLFVIFLTAGDAKQKWFRSERNNHYYIDQDYAFTWFEAFLECSYRNMSLLTLETLEKHNEIANILVKDDFKFNAPHLWIGAAGANRRFSWIANSKPVHTPRWIPNNPDNWNSEEICLHFWENTTLLNDRKCEYKYGFICETTPSSCPTDGREGHKYKQIVLNIT